MLSPHELSLVVRVLRGLREEVDRVRTIETEQDGPIVLTPVDGKLLIVHGDLRITVGIVEPIEPLKDSDYVEWQFL